MKRSDILNTNKLKGKIIESGFTVGELASLLGISAPTLYRKISNPNTMAIGEVILIKDILCISNTEACEIFLNQ